MRFEHWVYTIPLRLRSILKRNRVESELDEELQYHLERQTEEYIASGFDPAEARRAALRVMGGLAQRKEECRDARRVNGIDNSIRDIRYGLRMLAKAPGFTTVAVLTLALGIGANTAIFSVIDAVLLKPLGYPDPDRMVQLMLFSPGWAQGKAANTASVPEFNAFREQRSVFDQISAYESSVRGINLTGTEFAEQLRAIRVSANYFSLFGVKPAMGRTFSLQEDRPGGPAVCLLSDGLRQRRFPGANPVGKVLALSGEEYTVIGVLERSFAWNGAPEVFLPLRADPASTNQGHALRVAARLKPGVTLAQARAQLNIAHKEFLRRFPNWSGRTVASEGFTAEPLWDTTVGDSRRPLILLAGAVGLVLLIACANISNLLLARATGRKREIAVRTALGASRGRIACQLLIESLLLSFAGGACGLLVAIFSVRAIMAIQPGNIPRLDNVVALNTPALLFALFLSIASGLLFGVIPVFSNVSRLGGGADLVAWSVRTGASAGQKRARSVLVIAEVALALVLLTGAGLLVRTFWALRTVDAGFNAHNVLTMEMSVAGTRFERPAALAGMIRDAERRIENLPGVIAAAATLSLPLESQLGGPVTVEGHPDDSYGANRAFVSRRYFDVFRIPVRDGRAFREEDDERSAPVALINEAMAQGRNSGMRWSGAPPWRNRSPVGERVTMFKGMGPPLEDPTREVIGVTGEVRDAGLNRNPIPMLYSPIAQLTEGLSGIFMRALALHWVVRTKNEPYAVSAAVERELRTVSGGLPVAHVRTMEQIVSESTARERFNMTLLCVFAAVALLLGAIGVYGVMVYAVQRRTQEIGLRVALGARPRDVRAMVVFEAMRLVVIGIAIGVGAALVTLPLMSSLLFEVKAHDPVVMGCTVLVLGAAALLATYIPACRATRVDPVTALRCE